MLNWIPKKEINVDLVNEMLKKSQELNQFTNNGPNVKLLEEYIRKNFKIHDTKAVIVVTNGAVALHALSSGIQYTEKTPINWATQAFTFPPSAQSNLSTVKIIDIDLDGGINLADLDNTINGIIVTNIFGNVVDIDKYVQWAKINNKYLIFDNAATAYTFYKGENCINYGDGCIISFHHTKPFGFGEGGAIIVDKKYEYSIRCLNNFGIGLTDNYWVKEGNNNKMSDISAVYILQFLMCTMETIIDKHMRLYNYFKRKIEEEHIVHFKLFPSFHKEEDRIVPSCFSLIFENYADSIRLKLLENNIFCRKYYHPLNDAKNANVLFEKILCLPCTTEMTNADIDRIIQIINNI
jgi:dTDP-4-amino-4,6-dideoxygalactose transaminase